MDVARYAVRRSVGHRRRNHRALEKYAAVKIKFAVTPSAPRTEAAPDTEALPVSREGPGSLQSTPSRVANTRRDRSWEGATHTTSENVPCPHAMCILTGESVARL